MAGQDAVGFWSYVHADNEADDKRITNLARRLISCYGLTTGRKLELFVDRESIIWGEAWRERIDNAIAGTTFFFPIITPRYFDSQECRRELLKFVSESRRRGVERLLLPIYYIEVEALEHEPSDEVMAIVAKRQWEDVKDIRLVEESSAGHRVAVNRLAKTVADISDELARVPRELDEKVFIVSESEEAIPAADESSASHGLAPTVGLGGGDGPQAAANLLIAQLTQMFTESAGTLGAMTAEAKNVTALVNRATAETDESDRQGGGFADRTAVLQRYAEDLREPAERIEALGQDYARQLIEANPAMLTLLALMEEGVFPASQADLFADATKKLYMAAKEQADIFSGFLEALSGHVRLSRSLQEPVGHLRAGTLAVLDAIGVIEEWNERVSRSRPTMDTGDGQ